MRMPTLGRHFAGANAHGNVHYHSLLGLATANGVGYLSQVPKFLVHVDFGSMNRIILKGLRFLSPPYTVTRNDGNSPWTQARIELLARWAANGNQPDCRPNRAKAYCAASSTRFVRARSPTCALFSVARNFLVKSCCRWKSCAACDL